MATKIYTKTGDSGMTSLIGGTRVPKNHIRIETYGTVDELNAYIGLIADLITDSHSIYILREIQDRLFTIGSSLACDAEKAPSMKIPDLKPEDVSLLEKEIDLMNEFLPEMKSFILPGGHSTVSHIHITRCVCRRSERLCVLMQVTNLSIEPLIIQYFNRLSDYLFVLGRFIGLNNSVPEILWKPRL